MISPKERLYKVVWEIIQEIKEEGLIVPKDEWILIDTSSDERRRALRYLVKLGIIKALEYETLRSPLKIIQQINGMIYKANAYKVDILQPKFDKIYEKFRKENDIKNTIEGKETIKSKSLVKKEENDKVRFSPKIPSNTKWGDIIIRFKNEYDVDIIIGKNKYPYDYEKMGFADNRIKKSEEKTKTKDSWNLLQLLAIGNGEFPLNHLIREEKEKRIKQKQFLTKILKEFFSTINDDPFCEYDDTQGIYKIKIKLIPVKDFIDDFRDKNIKDESNDNLGIKESYEDQTAV